MLFSKRMVSLFLHDKQKQHNKLQAFGQLALPQSLPCLCITTTAHPASQKPAPTG
jgi:hypothetical protein